MVLTTRSETIGRRNEEKVAEDYRRQGYQVINVNKKGFPDLIALEDGKIEFFVEVKGGRHKVHEFQKEIHEELKNMGFLVKTVRV